MSEIAIRVQNLTKKYSIGKQKDGSLRGTLGTLFSGGKSAQEDFLALNNVSFDIQQGDVVGIIGKNGAGKSTLLKVLSQITKPTEGRIEINGRVASLLEVGTGFHPELTGRENIYLNGTILGMTRKEVSAKFDEIVEFSGVEKFIDTPVKHYSSGMYVRLAFAVAAHLEPEILIIDEVLAVGDAEFQKKCLGKMQDVAGQGRTVLFVSHNIGAIKSLCTKGVLIEKGKIKKISTIDDVISDYQDFSGETSYSNLISKKKIFVKSVELLNKSNEVTSNDEISFLLNLHFSINVNFDIRILIRIFDLNENVITSFEMKIIKNEYKLIIPSNFLKKGSYSLNVILYSPSIEVYDEVNCCGITVINNNEVYSHLEGFNIGSIYSNEKWLQ